MQQINFHYNLHLYYLHGAKRGNVYNSIIIYSKECSCVRKDKINYGLQVFRPSTSYPIIKNPFMSIFFISKQIMKFKNDNLLFYLIRNYSIG